MTAFEYILTGVAILLLLSILVNKASGALSIPSLLVFLFIGMMAGSEGIGGIYFDSAEIAQALGTVALAYIIFAGGVDTSWQDIRPILKDGLILSTLCTFFTALIIGFFSTLALGFSLLEGLLLGSIISSTDAAAVFAILRSKRVKLHAPIKSVLEFESGSNDPMAVFLTIGFCFLIKNTNYSSWNLLLLFVKQMSIGAVMGYVFGKMTQLLVNRLRLDHNGLYPVLTLSMVLLAYCLVALMGGSGFLAVYVAGLVLGNGKFIHKNSLIDFHNGIAWLMQIVMFLTMGLFVFPSQLVSIIPIGLLLSAVLIFAARPIAVFATLCFSKFKLREKIMISWVGLRGAVPIILATFPLILQVPKANTMFNLVFFIVLTSALLQGTSIPIVAKWLGLAESMDTQKTHSWDMIHNYSMKHDLVELSVSDIPDIVGKQIVELQFPKETLIVLLKRGTEFIVPTGSTVFEQNDKMLVLTDKNNLKNIHSLTKKPQTSSHTC